MSPLGRVRGWTERWGPVLPVLVPEFVILLGFGSLLPVMPLYVVQHGIDLPTLGLITAAWAMAKLVSEPFFGYVADRTHRRKALMVIGVTLLGIFTILPLFFTSATALFVLRLLSGASAGMYDPAARGILVDRTTEGERGEVFGLYSAAQMGGFLVGPVIGALGAALVGGYGFPFAFTGALTFLAAGYLVLFLRPDRPGADAVVPEAGHEPARAHDVIATPHDFPLETPLAPDAEGRARAPLRALLNRTLVAAIVVYFGASLAFGVYEVIWTLYMTHLGASLTWVGLTFTIFGAVSAVFSPIAGRIIDRSSPIRFVIGGGVGIAVAGAIYAIAQEPVMPTLVIPFEAVAEAFLVPALYALVARGSPLGLTSTAQGMFGAAGTVALIVASVAGGYLFAQDPSLPFWFFVAGLSIALVVGLVIYSSGSAGRVDQPAGSPAEA
jgi:MFS family permease